MTIDIDKERKAFEASFRAKPYSWNDWHFELAQGSNEYQYSTTFYAWEAWQARAKQHSGEAEACSVCLHQTTYCDDCGTEMYKPHLSPQQPQGQDKLVEKAVAEALEKVIDLVAYHEANDGDSGEFNITGLIKEIRKLINQPTQKE